MDKMCWPITYFRKDNDPMLESGVIGATIANVCRRNIARSRQPLSNKTARDWGQWTRWKVTNEAAHLVSMDRDHRHPVLERLRHSRIDVLHDGD